tara:strand:- start:1879 stop:2571 length:693 start_codon:yes stop_codon:yes gene_type:complete
MKNKKNKSENKGKENSQKVNKKIEKNIEKGFKNTEAEKKSYFQSIGIFVFSFIIFLSCAYFSYKAYFSYQPPNEFIVLDQEYRILEEKPLEQEVENKEEMVNKVNQWVSNIFDYHHLNIDTHGEKIKEYFATESSYSEFMDTFTNLRLQDRVRALNAIVTSKIVKPIHIVDSGVYNGFQRFYQMDGVIIAEIVHSEGKEVIRYNVTMIVARRSLVENPNGYAIEVIAFRG